MPLPRILALDVGNRRIGIALSDALCITAQPLLTLHRTSPRADFKSIARLIRKHAVTTVLIGLPVHASGEASAQSARTQAFADGLQQHFAAVLAQPPQIVFLDERHTTAEAHALLGPRTSATDRLARRDHIDQVAATLLLEAWLRAQSPALLPDPDDPATQS